MIINTMIINYDHCEIISYNLQISTYWYICFLKSSESFTLHKPIAYLQAHLRDSMYKGWDISGVKFFIIFDTCFWKQRNTNSEYIVNKKKIEKWITWNLLSRTQRFLVLQICYASTSSHCKMLATVNHLFRIANIL